MPASIITTNEEEFDEELTALADKFESLEVEEEEVELEGTKLQAYRTAIHVKRAAILLRVRTKLTSDKEFGKWKNSRASLQKLSQSRITDLQSYGRLLPVACMRATNQDYTKIPSMRMIQPLTHSEIPIKVAQKAVADHINEVKLLDYAAVKEIRKKYIKPKVPKQISMADRATIELRLAVQPHLTGENLLGCGFGACADSIKILAKHFRQKHHPDKGGSPLDYARINDAAAEALKNVR